MLINTPIQRIVIWGLRNQFHTHRYIHKGFYFSSLRLGFETIWLDDEYKNNFLLKETDLIITVNIASNNLQGSVNAYYCLHNSQELETRIINKFGNNKVIKLQVYTKGCDVNSIKISSATYYNELTKTLYQPWGTDINEKDFMKYSTFKFNRLSFWIGSVWNNEYNQGNKNEINILKKILSKNKIFFVKARPKSEFVHKHLINKSVICPAIAGAWQVANGYLPCRMFKNISYGSIGISNVNDFQLIFEDNLITKSNNIEIIVEESLRLEKNKAIKLLQNQQRLIINHTYENKLKNIISTFEL